MQLQGEHGGRTLCGQQGARGAVERVIALTGVELRRVGERREVREHHEVVPHGRALQRIAGAREQPVVLVERVRVGRERQPEAREVGLVGGHRALAAIHREGECHGLPCDLAPTHAVGAPDLEAERRRRGRHAGSRVVHEAQRVHEARVGSRRDGERPDAAPRAAGRLAHRDVGHGEVVALVEPAGEREPGAAGIGVVVPPLQQDLPLKRSRALRDAVHRLRPRATGHGAQAPDVLVAVR